MSINGRRLGRMTEELSFVVFLHALGFLVGDALMAIDAGLAVALGHFMLLARALLLLFPVHAHHAVAVAALQRVVRLHAFPLAFGQLEPLGLELLARVHAAGDLAVELARGLDLPQHLRPPLLRHVAVGAYRAHPGAVGVVDGVLVFLVDVVAHLVAADAERLGVGRLHHGVEAAPENDAGGETAEHQDQEGILGAGPPQCAPEAAEEGFIVAVRHVGIRSGKSVATSARGLAAPGLSCCKVLLSRCPSSCYRR